MNGRRAATVIGIAGTAKNTGKTTTMNQVMSFLAASGKTFAVTSVGFDGEDFDTVTGLAKPRVFVPAGTIVATAQPLLKSARIQWDEVRDSGVSCALGRVSCGRASDSGRVVLAGPQTTRGLRSLLTFLVETWPLEAILVDGAFSRLAPMAAASHLLFATGAARSGDVSLLCREIDGIGTVMQLPVFESDGEVEVDLGTSLMSRSSVPLGVMRVLKDARGRCVVRVRGPVSPRAVLDLGAGLARDDYTRVRLVFDHPLSLLVTGEACFWPEVIQGLARGGHEIGVRSTASLVGFTLNPAKPACAESGRGYRLVSGDAYALLHEVRMRTRYPVTDVVLEGPSVLWSWLEQVLDAPGGSAVV